mmetsp:Transcript_9369/g.7153  ORF Transcript_9369/g.7153 Transcript_9369/m.7153 type:complete len:119 (+) Transcript_9369:179-535(+)
MIIQYMQMGILNKNQHVNNYINMFYQKRTKLMQNFFQANNSLIQKENYQVGLESLLQRQDYVDVIKEMKLKPKVPYKLHISPRELIKYERMSIRDLKIQKQYSYKYLEVEIELEPIKG